VEGRGFISIFGQHIISKIKCVGVNVYATCNLNDKVTLWEELTTIKNANKNLAWCLCGVFNAVRCENERKGKSERGNQNNEITGFNHFIERNFLVELPIVGKKYTWYKENGTTKSRLDKVLLSDVWLRKWPMGKQYVQPREVSDHCAIVVKCLAKDWGPRSFRTIDS